MMQATSERAILTYVDAYQRVYQRTPTDLRVVDQEWVVVNGARMRFTELEFITEQLENEYRKAQRLKKSAVMRLINLLK